MTFAILGGGQLDTGYTIDNSLRFNDGDSAYLTRTPAGEGNRDTFTISFWLKRGVIGTRQFIISPWGGSTNNYAQIEFYSTDAIFIQNIVSNVQQLDLRTNRKFRDVSAWYHIVLAVDSTQATASNRAKLYVNGVQETSFSTETYMSQNNDTYFNDDIEHNIGRRGDGSNFFDGYLAEFYMIDGQQLSPTDFGEFDADSGIWKPIQYTGTYGTNGFYLDFEDSAALGDDVSGNGNDFTPTNLASTDQTTDSPTNNFATINSTLGSGLTISEGNTLVTVSSTIPRAAASTFSLNTGKWYCEVKFPSTVYSGATLIGVEADDFSQNSTAYSNTDGAYYIGDGTKYIDGVQTSYGASYTTNDIIGIALNLDDDEITFYKNGTSQGAITTKTFTGGYYFVGTHGSGSNSSQFNFNFGNPSFSITSGNTDNNGYGNFEYAPPSGFLALCAQNLATELSPTIDDGSQYFNAVLYSGNGGTNRSITGMGFQPDWLWHKERSSVRNHSLVDSTRGTNASLQSNSTNAESTMPSFVSFDSDGFTVTQDGSTNPNWNESGVTKVVWGWLVNGGTTSSNTDGSTTSTVQANTTAGFSIVTYTGTGSSATIGHGLGVKPDMVIVKSRSASARGWVIWHNALAGNEALELNITDAKITSTTSWNSTVPTSSVFSVGTRVGTNESGTTYVAYCFADIEGYSKFGSYTGNGSTDGAFIYTGFRPAFVIIKRTDNIGNWFVYDTARDTFNVADAKLEANDTDAEVNPSSIILDILSNGFKQRSNNSQMNASGGTYIYMAFAENPFVSSSGVPVTAR